MNGGAERWALLLATLLHDIPWKPWVVARKLGEQDRLEARVRRECKQYAKIIKAEEEANDKEAQALVAWLACRLEERGAGEAAETLVRVAEREWGRAIHYADVIAASVDRLVSPPVKPGRVSLVNIFNPSFTIEMDVLGVSPENVRKFIEQLLERLKNLIDDVLKSCGCGRGGCGAECVLRRLYLVLYTMLEVEWYRVTREKLGAPIAPPADTRVPHHTVFDHLRAAATSLALRRKSVYALIDIPGVHLFISAARKTRDFWAGSWLVSALAWSTVRRIVESEGPQVVILPAVHLNPFYLDMLVSEVPGVETRLPWLAWEALGKWPSQPLMPATISVILDGERWWRDKLRKEVEEGLRGAWEKLWEELRERLEDRLRKLKQGGLPDWCNPQNWSAVSVGRRDFDALAEVVSRLLCLHALSSTGGNASDAAQLLEKLFEYLLKAMREPPIGVRVTCVEVDFGSKDYMSFVDEVLKELERITVKINEREEVGAAKLIEEIVREAKKKSGEEFRGDARTLLDRMLRFTYLRLKLEEAAREEPNVALTGIHRVYEGVKELWEKAKEVSHRAYRYCSVCGKLPAVARVPRIGESIATPWGEVRIVGSRGEKSEPNDWELRELLGRIDYLADEGEALCPYCLLRRLLARYPWIAYSVVRSAERAKRIRVDSTLDTANRWVRDSLCQKLAGIVGEQERVSCEELSLEYVIRALEMAGRRPRYYRRIAVVYGDGDSLGSGYLRGVLVTSDLHRLGGKTSPANLVNRYEVFKKLLERLPNDVWDDAAPALAYNYILQLNAHGQVDVNTVLALAALTAAITRVLRRREMLEDKWPLTVIPSPSYLRVFSTSLMVTSLVDALIVDSLGGILVYAGGDDVLAVMPPAAPLDKASSIWEELRKRLKEDAGGLWGCREPEACIPLLPGQGVERRDKKDGSVSLALAAVYYTRLNYWGLLSGAPGFHVYDGIVAQATVAHGRSYGVELAHYRNPLWSSMSNAEHLMNMKDEAKVYIVGDDGTLEPRIPRKDVMIVGFEGGAEGIVPQCVMGLGEYPRLRGRVGPGRLEGLELVARLYGLVDGGMYSRSVVYDALEEVNTRLASLLATSPKHLEKLARSILARNRGGGETPSEENQLVKGLGRAIIYRDDEPETLLEHVFRAVRHLLAAARR